MPGSFSSLIALLLSFLLFSLSTSEPSSPAPDALLANGLSWTFYESSCPQMELIVRRYLHEELRKDIGLAAGLLRLHFHDCFVQGCDGSILLKGTEKDPSEQASIPNLSLRPRALAIINELQNRVVRACGPVVSCADIVAAAARDSVFLSRGPSYGVPYGRRDALASASNATTLANLPAPFFDVTKLLSAFHSKGLDATDLVALSGAHTIGRAHCPSFTNRLYPKQDPAMDTSFASRLYSTCPAADSKNLMELDVETPNVFDNRYFADLARRRGLLTSDQGLYGDERTRKTVEGFARDGWLFFEKFGEAMVKMGQVGVLTGVQGEVRRDCAVVNSRLASVVDAAAEYGDLLAA